MKTILCYGDSNTWGYDPANQTRYPRDVRWPGVLRNGLGDGYIVIEEGLNGRTTVWDDPIELDKNGATYLRPCIQTHKPLDFVIIMLGTNDLKTRFSLPAYDIASGAGVLVDIVDIDTRIKFNGVFVDFLYRLGRNFLVLVNNFTYQLFENIFDGNDTCGTSVFIKHNCDM